MFLYSVLLLSIISGVVTALVAKQKQRNAVIWFFLGFCFGLFSLIFVSLLPSKGSPKTNEVASFSYADSSAQALPPEENMPATSSEKILRIPMNLNIDWYYIDQNLTTQGPFKLKELRRIVVEKKLSEETYIWCDECDDWTPIKAFSNRSTVFDPALVDLGESSEVH